LRSLGARGSSRLMSPARPRRSSMPDARCPMLDARWTMDHGTWTMDDGPWTMDHGPWTMDDGRRTMDHGPGTPVARFTTAMLLTERETIALEATANDIRESVIEMLVDAGSGHTAGPLAMADVFTVLYFHTLRQDPKNPAWEDRDRLILSNGHICPVLYATMAYAGYFPKEWLKTLRKFGSPLQGHPYRMFLPSLETSSGPLGEGLSQAVGMAIADKMDGIQAGSRR